MDLVEEIIEIELEMFMSVPAEGDPSCREAPESFRLHRSAQFSVWSEETLRSYLADLRAAKISGRNLMTYKYARMDELIPAENASPMIPLLLERQVQWQAELVALYPGLRRNARGVTDGESSRLSVSFKRYLSAELESYSEKTLSLLNADTERYASEGINMSEKIYENLALAAGCDLSDILG